MAGTCASCVSTTMESAAKIAKTVLFPSEFFTLTFELLTLKTFYIARYVIRSPPILNVIRLSELQLYSLLSTVICDRRTCAAPRDLSAVVDTGYIFS